MVPDSGASSRTSHLRPLNVPREVEVIVAKGTLVTLIDGKHRVDIERVQDRWIIEEEWWRARISRQYFSLLLADGSRRTVFHDRVTNTWYAQEYE